MDGRWGKLLKEQDTHWLVRIQMNHWGLHSALSDPHRHSMAQPQLLPRNLNYLVHCEDVCGMLSVGDRWAQ